MGGSGRVPSGHRDAVLLGTGAVNAANPLALPTPRTHIHRDVPSPSSNPRRDRGRLTD